MERKQTKQFKRIYFEITNICNVQCSFCPEVERSKKNLKVSEFESVIKQIVPLTEDVCFHLMGEPLVHKEIGHFFEIVEKHSGKVNLTTNGLLLSEKSKVLVEAKSLRQINISIQSFFDNFPNRSPVQYYSDIFDFIDLMTLNRPEVYINLRLWNIEGDTSKNEDFFKAIEEKFKIEINRKVHVNFKKSKKLFSRLYLHFDSRFTWPSKDLPFRSKQGTCQGLRNHFGILADGSVVPCCLDKEAVINLGNIFKDTIDSILGNERSQNIIKGFESGNLVEDLCQRCPYILRFKV